jgi:polyisoprenoid-binding protein YceI
MFKPFAAALVATLAVSTVASAQGAAPAVQSGSYALETHHAEVVFSVSHLGFSTYYGQFPGATGNLTLDGANPAASQLDVTVPVSDLWTASSVLTGELKAADWLNAAAFPNMTFRSTKITMTGATTADVTGDLTLHGVTHTEVLKARFTRDGTNPMTKNYTIGFEVSGKIKRADFGVTKDVPFISDEVTLTISAPFERKAS